MRWEYERRFWDNLKKNEKKKKRERNRSPVVLDGALARHLDERPLAVAGEAADVATPFVLFHQIHLRRAAKMATKL